MKTLKQCEGKTKKGYQCRRMLSGRAYCLTHLSQDQISTEKNSNKTEDNGNQTEDKSVNEEEISCCICLEILDSSKNSHTLEKCSHTMHLECIMGLRKLECPLCRKEIEDKKVLASWKQKEGPDYEDISPFFARGILFHFVIGDYTNSYNGNRLNGLADLSIALYTRPLADQIDDAYYPRG